MIKKVFNLLLIVVSTNISGQVSDTIDYLNGYISESEDSLYIDTTIQENIQQKNYDKINIFYDSLKIKADRKKWSRELHNLFVRNRSNISERVTPNDNSKINYFEQFDQKYIRKIIIDQIEVFGPSINDTSKKATHFSQKLGNTLHISTSKSAIRRNLFISENEKVDAYLLADNERLLRNIPNLQDARIFVLPIAGCTDSVDIKILTKDVWPVALGIEIFDLGYGKIGLWNNNFLGLGHYFNITGLYNLNKDPDIGYKARYNIPNIARTFTTLDLHHDDYWDYYSNKVYLVHRFLTPETRFGGGIGYENVNQTKSIITLDSILQSETSNYELVDLWGGYSHPLKVLHNLKIRKSIFISARQQNFLFFKRPLVDSNYLHAYHNRQIKLLSIGMVWQGYQSTNLVYGFGDTEDLPYGGMLKLTVGKEDSEFSSRYYVGATLVASKNFNKVGYFSHTLEFGTYYKSTIEQGTLKYEFLYFSPLFGTRRHLFRQFTNIKYLHGYNRFKDEYIEITDKEGVRGLFYNNLKGDKSLYLKTELDYYSPNYVYGFRFVYFLFLDIGVINSKNSTLFDNDAISSIGIGFRVRNERLVFNTIQFRFCYFPNSQNIPDESKRNLELTSVARARIPEFADKVPGMVEY